LSTTYFRKTGNLRRRRGLQEVDLQERLEVQVSDLLTILRAEELGELGVRDDTALEVGVKAAVLADIGRNELGHIRLGALRLRGQTHEGGQLIGDGAELQERVVRATGIIRRTLLRTHRRGVLAHTALGVTRLTLQCLRSIRRLAEHLANTGGHLSANGAQAVLDRGEQGISAAGLGGQRGRGSDRDGGSGNRRGGGGSDRDIDNGLGGGSLLRSSLRGSGGLGGSGHLVCINGGLRRGHF